MALEWELSELLHWESSVEQLLRVAEVSPSALDVLKIPAITAFIKERRELLDRNGIIPPWPCPLSDLHRKAHERYGEVIPD